MCLDCQAPNWVLMRSSSFQKQLFHISLSGSKDPISVIGSLVAALVTEKKIHKFSTMWDRDL